MHRNRARIAKKIYLPLLERLGGRQERGMNGPADLRLYFLEPVVIANLYDPVRAGIVTNLARPGENITGFTTLSVGLAGGRK